MTTASTSLASAIASIPASVWSYANRTLTDLGTLVSDIWNSVTRTLTSVEPTWALHSSDFGTITAGSSYLATVNTIYQGVLTDSGATPTATVYDPSRNVVVSNVPMTRTATGTYTYSYVTASNAAAGTWETDFNAVAASGVTLVGSDFWNVVTTPAQVIINSMQSTAVPNISANITITDEGLSGNEYQYEWCVVSQSDNSCGGGDDVYDATAAKYINAGEDFNTTLTATVPTPGNYYFKVVAYFGTDSSVASRSFTATGSSGNTGGVGGGGGGGGGGGAPAPAAAPVATPKGPVVAGDINGDNKVTSLDFSILLYYWKAKPPFKNPAVDFNKDGKVDSADFSIFLYYLGKH